ncbi:uroporphyrinogen decarboxylase [Candidatus Uabimicrobium amorphum]|uniref:Uroporphyrinogen decarboxylase n=1 Tax=Uabimicrobium amorphum TaxID=2596890 RepID=A0A5S9F367_UABAM|nr:uroporphyrinogen decarboxylase [Candidatus Uabimicrobium amorphum]BBM82842.1 uroporphyrinogen decarboxylase [Candidatus Uabimicrobium amorphum]
MNFRQRFLAACKREKVDHPPIWLMRQAGRYLPEYRALKEKYDFLTLVKTPELATEVTMQPIKRFGFDAAILFSDILVIPEALGQPYSFRDIGGIEMQGAIRNAQDIARLDNTEIQKKLSYVADAIRLIKKELNDERALIGFSGAPWTLATYMVEGGSSKNYSQIKTLFYLHPTLFNQLMEKLSDAVSDYLQMQIDAGVDCVQIFDSWGGILSADTYWEASGKYIARIISSLKGKVPVIAYAKGCHIWPEALERLGADVLGLDWTIPLEIFYDTFDGEFAVQGNLDPALMNSHPDIVEKEAQKILEGFGERKGHIFNLGHGILPQAKIECVERLIATVRGFK